MSDDRNPPAAGNEIFLSVGIEGFEDTMEKLQALDAMLESIAEKCERIGGAEPITINNYTFNAATSGEDIETLKALAIATEKDTE